MTADLPGLVQQIAYFAARLEADPGSRVFLPLADLHRRAGKLDEARRILELGLEEHGDFITARAALGLVLSELGEDEAARKALRTVLAADQDNLLALRLLASDAGKSGDWAHACGLYERLLRMEPEDHSISEALREARWEREKMTPLPRQPEMDAIIDPGPMTPPPVVRPPAVGGFETPTLAELYLRQGHPGKARVILERILATEPGRPDALEVMAKLEAGETASPQKAAASTPAPSSQAERAEHAESAAVPRRMPAADSAPLGRGEELDRFRDWLDAATDQRGSPN